METKFKNWRGIVKLNIFTEQTVKFRENILKRQRKYRVAFGHKTGGK